MKLSKPDSSPPQYQQHKHQLLAPPTHMPQLHATHSRDMHTLAPPTQTGAMPPRTDLPTHTLSHIYAGPVQNHRDTYRCNQDAH